MIVYLHWVTDAFWQSNDPDFNSLHNTDFFGSDEYVNFINELDPESAEALDSLSNEVELGPSFPTQVHIDDLRTHLEDFEEFADVNELYNSYYFYFKSYLKESEKLLRSETPLRTMARNATIESAVSTIKIHNFRIDRLEAFVEQSRFIDTEFRDELVQTVARIYRDNEGFEELLELNSKMLKFSNEFKNLVLFTQENLGLKPAAGLIDELTDQIAKNEKAYLNFEVELMLNRA